MINHRFRLFLFLLAALMVCVVSQTRAADEDHPVEDAAKFKLQTKANPALPTLYLVGDSTMKVGTPGQRGWGEEMAPYFDPKKINVVNEAIGGRSSRTYQTEGRWAAVVAMLQKGDFVIIQFGHNDGGAINDTSRARATIKGVGDETQEIDNLLTKKHEVVHSYGWYMAKYVKDVQSKGAIPIVMSLTPRNSWADGKVTRASGNNYGGWAKQVADATGAIFVDHNEVIAEGYEKLGQEKTAPMYQDGRLHTTPAGAAFNAKMAVSGLKAIAGHPLDQYLSEEGKAVPVFEGEKK
jgi:lysophospholipase L1-like esterase